jgi:hypothetical protein
LLELFEFFLLTHNPGLSRKEKDEENDPPCEHSYWILSDDVLKVENALDLVVIPRHLKTPCFNCNSRINASADVVVYFRKEITSFAGCES